MKVSAIETIETIKGEEKQAREDLKAQEKKNRDELKERFVKAREEAFTQYKETQALLKQLREANEARKTKSKSTKSSPKAKRGIESTVIYKEGDRFGTQSSQDGTNQVKATQLETLIGVTIPKDSNSTSSQANAGDCIGEVMWSAKGRPISRATCSLRCMLRIRLRSRTRRRLLLLSSSRSCILTRSGGATTSLPLGARPEPPTRRPQPPHRHPHRRRRNPNPNPTPTPTNRLIALVR